VLTFTRSLFLPPAPGKIGHYHSIDFGRGLAALVVLVWHYQHFFFSAGSTAPNIAVSAQPFYKFLEPLYLAGYYAVDYFWAISGFVFAAVYLARSTNSRAFVVHRIARLYPLHLLTLSIVAALQLSSRFLCGHEQIYVNNDLWHFVLNMFFASHWGLEKGYSFNGPVWSVSVEVMIYAAFWLTLPFLYSRGLLWPGILACICWFLHFRTPLLRTDEQSLLCAFYFFSGVIAWLVVSKPDCRPLPVAAVAVAAVAAGLAVFYLRARSIPSVGMPLFLFGLLLLFCAVELTGSSHRFRSLQWFGNCTYGTYLWHVPIQILTLIVLDRFFGTREPALHGWFFVAFVLLTVGTARLSYIWIERPARAWILRRYGEDRARQTLISPASSSRRG